MDCYKIVIIGGGPAGLAAAISAKQAGVDDILILERDDRLGGILNQCIHNGFGLHTFKEELTGPEYAARFIERVKELGITYCLHTMVIDISEDKVITAVSEKEGLRHIKAEAIVLAMGCRERPRGALNIPGYRPAGIYNAGTAQRLVNIEGYMPGKEVVILGSGDIGLIMARRLTLEGAKVKVVAEIMPYSGGLKRNIVQCLDDFGIPLKLSHTVVDIKGRERVEAVTIAQVDENRQPVPGTEETYTCDTLLLSVGLIPENELSEKIHVNLDARTNGPVVNESFETSVPGVFACGNVLHVHDLVDFGSEEAKAAGIRAAEYVQREASGEKTSPAQPEKVLTIVPQEGINYTVPKYIHPDKVKDAMKIRFRVKQIYENAAIRVYVDGEPMMRKKKRIFAPGEMEEITLGRKELEQIKGKKELMMFTQRNRKMWKYMKMHLRCGDKFIKTWQIKHLI